MDSSLFLVVGMVVTSLSIILFKEAIGIGMLKLGLGCSNRRLG